MPIDKNYWLNLSFRKDSFPSMVCPNCNKGHLELIEKNKFIGETSRSRKERVSDDYGYWDPTYIEYRFSFILKCSIGNCEDTTLCIGKGSQEPYNEQYFENGIERFEQRFEHYFNPIYFLPSLKIIPLKKEYPKSINNELENSFSMFFADVASCANKIRICIEILMDELKVKKTNLKSGKRISLSLNSRINEFKKKNPEVGEFLLAIKWIGNSGSHYDQLTKNDILDAYCLLEHSLNLLYDNQNLVLKKLSSKINKKKAPLSKKRK